MKNDYEAIVNYVEAASVLAESIARDIKGGKEYTTETVVALSTFISAAYDVSDIVKSIEDINRRLS